MARPHAMLRAGFPYLKCLGSRNTTFFPNDIAIGKEGRVYVMCRSERAETMAQPAHIVRLTLDDDVLGRIGGGGTEDGNFQWPVMVILDQDENLYVSDEALNRITISDREGKFLGKWGEYGSGDGQLNRPAGIAFDPDDDMYVVDSLNNRIQKFTKDGKFLLKWGEHGAGDGQFNMPWGITVDELGDVYVVDWRNDRIQKFTAEGDFIFSFGTSGTGNGEFSRPSGVAVDLDGDIYVADLGNNRVQMFTAEGRYLQKFLGDATLGKLSRAFALNNLKGLRLRETANLEEAKLLRDPRSVRVDDQGRLYIVDYGSFRIQVYQKDVVRLGPDQLAAPVRSPTMETS